MGFFFVVPLYRTCIGETSEAEWYIICERTCANKSHVIELYAINQNQLSTQLTVVFNAEPLDQEEHAHNSEVS